MKNMKKWVRVLTVVVLLFAAALQCAPAGDAAPKKWKIGIAAGKMGNTWTAQFADAVAAGMEKYIADGIVAEYQLASTDGDITE